MSYDIGVFIQKKNLPTASQWKTEIKQQGFPCELDNEVNLSTLSGFLPCRINGKIAGFEYYASHAEPEEVSDLAQTTDKPLPPVDYAITVSSSAKELDFFCALAAASCLTKMTDGYLVDYYSGDIILSEQAIRWAHALPEIADVLARGYS